MEFPIVIRWYLYIESPLKFLPVICDVCIFSIARTILMFIRCLRNLHSQWSNVCQPTERYLRKFLSVSVIMERLFAGLTDSWYGPKGPFLHRIRCPMARFREPSKPLYWQFQLSYRFEIWQTHRQHCYRGPCQISGRCGHCNTHSRDFVASWELTIRWRTA